MKKGIILLVIATTGLSSCGQGIRSTPDTITKETFSLTQKVERQQLSNNLIEKYIDTKYEYSDSAAGKLIVRNSLPKGGLKYLDPNGQVYVYAIFWTRITNETANPLELSIDFPVDSFELNSSPGRNFRLFLPSDAMTLEKEDMFDYGVPVLKSFLDEGLQKASSLKRTINPKESNAFYVVTLFNRGVDGVLRAGFRLNDQNLIYLINGKEIQCGKISLKKLMFRN